MAQISKGDTFVDGQQVTGSRLNQLVDSAQLLVGAITDQPNITANTLEATDSTIVNDAGVLKEATIGDILNSNLPITTSSINGVAGADIVVVPAVGRKFDVNGAFETNSINSTGGLTVGGNASVAGNLAVTGATTLTGGVNGNFAVSGLVTASSVPTTGGHLTNKTYVDGAVSKTANGYVTLPNGLMIQWGLVSNVQAGAGVTVTFPVAFPTSCVSVVLTNISGSSSVSSGYSQTSAVFSVSRTSFVAQTGGSSIESKYWQAIGY